MSSREPSANKETLQILFVDDDVILNKMMDLVFKKENFQPKFITSYKEAFSELEKIKQNSTKYNLIVFDLKLPDGSGFDLLAFLRNFNDEIPVLILSGNDTETAKVKGLDSGADDYICKPFSMNELQARIKALLRRHNKNSGVFNNSKSDFKEIFTYKELKINFEAMEVSIKNKKINLTITEIKILEYLIKNINTIAARHNFIEYLRGGEYIENTSLNSHISRLRKKLKTYSKIIETVPGIGYKLKIA